jgi:hypothetical protein
VSRGPDEFRMRRLQRISLYWREAQQQAPLPEQTHHLAPLAQSVERIHGKEKFGLFLLLGDQQEQPFVQANADHSIWIK